MNPAAASAPIVVDIVCAVFNGAAYFGEFVSSLQAQTHQHWRLWLRDDGSSDNSLELCDRLALLDSRIQILHRGGPGVGACAAFGWLLERVAATANYVMCADQDDVWLPLKIEHSLEQMQRAERARPGPVLVHTDLRVVDASLTELAPSFWRLARLEPEPATIERLAVQSLVTGATVMVNRELLARALPVPGEAIMHDWWLSCVAAACGRVVALREVTIQYRQHGANAVGGARPRWDVSWDRLPAAALRALRRSAVARKTIDDTAQQAGAVMRRVEQELEPETLRFLRGYSALPGRGFFGRKLGLLRWRLRREEGVLRNLGLVLRG